MLGDVTPSQLRLIQTGTVYTGRDNKFTVTVQKYVGRSFVPADLSEVTQLLLIIPGAEPVVIDSLTYPDAFSVAGSLLTLDLSDFAFAPGAYTAQLVAFDAEHPRGQVLCETYENELTFTVRDVSATGSVPLPTLSYVEEAPANGVTYGRRDGVWVTIEAPVGVASVVIDEAKHLIITMTNGVTHDAGQLPSSDEVESIAAQLAEVVANVEQLQQTVGTLSDQVEAQGQTISTQTQTIALLTERVVQLEQGAPTDPEVPDNALTGAGGEPLTGPGGEYLLFVSSPIPENALTGTNDALLTSSAGQLLTTGEVT